MDKNKLSKILPYLIIILGVLYGVWPLDLIPDIPLIGWIDDLGIVGSTMLWAARLLAKRKGTPTRLES